MQIVNWNGAPTSRLPLLRFEDVFRRKCLLTLFDTGADGEDLLIQQSHSRVVVVLVRAYVEQAHVRPSNRGFLHRVEIGKRMARFHRGRLITEEAVVDHIFGLRKLMRPRLPLIESRDSYGYRIAPRGVRVDGI